MQSAFYLSVCVCVCVFICGQAHSVTSAPHGVGSKRLGAGGVLGLPFVLRLGLEHFLAEVSRSSVRRSWKRSASTSAAEASTSASR